MEYALEIKEEAIADMQKAYDYYEDCKTGLGERFLEAFEDYMDSIDKNPLLFQIKRKPYREAIIRGFPYVII